MNVGTNLDDVGEFRSAEGQVRNVIIRYDHLTVPAWLSILPLAYGSAQALLSLLSKPASTSWRIQGSDDVSCGW